MKPVVCPLTEAAYDVLELALPPPTELELIELPLGEEDSDDVPGCDWI